MSKAVLISVRPKWCELIANGKKTIEVRKTRPKLTPPFKCYIYESQGNKYNWNVKAETIANNDEDRYLDCMRGAPDVKRTKNGIPYFSYGRMSVIGEFTCDSISEYEAEFHKGNDVYQDIREIFRDPDNPDDDCRDFRILTANDDDDPNDCEFCKQTCLTFDEVKSYIGEECFCKTFYGWHISNLKIYDKPKELSEFYRECPGVDDVGLCYECEKAVGDEFDCGIHHELHLTRPPQSWCYVEENIWL